MPDRSSSPRSAAEPRAADAHDTQRLQKILAGAGIGSRRKCEELILAGRVEVGRRVVKTLGAKADPAVDEIRVDGAPLPQARPVYFMVNKPTGVVSTNRDPAGRPRVIDLVPYPGRLFTVGRLDMSSEGLILVTNDGELANRLTHPRYGVEKTYQVEVAGVLERKDLEKLRKGVHLAEGFAHAVSVRVIRQYRQSTMLEIVLNEGRNREIRRLLARVGHKVERLKRVALGPLRLAELPPGAVRPLEHEELRRLKKGGQASPERRKRPRGKSPAARKIAKPGAPARAVIGGDQQPARPPRPAGRPRRQPAGATGGKGKAFAGKSRRPHASGKPAR